MVNLNLPKAVEKIIVLHNDGPITIHHRKKKRKHSKHLKPMRKLLRTAVKSHRIHADEFLKRADRSDGKKRNGWIKDLGRNSSRASKKSAKVWRKAYN